MDLGLLLTTLLQWEEVTDQDLLLTMIMMKTEWEVVMAEDQDLLLTMIMMKIEREDMEESDTEWEVVMAEDQKVVLEVFEVVMDQNLEMGLKLAWMSFQAITKIPFAIHNLMKQAAK